MTCSWYFYNVIFTKIGRPVAKWTFDINATVPIQLIKIWHGLKIWTLTLPGSVSSVSYFNKVKVKWQVGIPINSDVGYLDMSFLNMTVPRHTSITKHSQHTSVTDRKTHRWTQTMEKLSHTQMGTDNGKVVPMCQPAYRGHKVPILFHYADISKVCL